MENQDEDSKWDDIGIQGRTYLKMKSNMEKDGYREGIEEGRNKVYQKYFDEGFAEGFKNGFYMGQLKGAIWAERIVTGQKDSNQGEELESTSTGACIICKDEKSLSLPVARIQSNQMEMLKKSILNIEQKTGKIFDRTSLK